MKPKRFFASSLLMAFLCIAGCTDSGQPLGVIPIPGSFQYTGYDLNGIVVITGRVTIASQNSHLTGERYLTSTTGAVDSGAFSGSLNDKGEFETFFETNTLGGIYIVGTPNTISITGEVFFTTGAGPRGRKVGTFKLLPIM